MRIITEKTKNEIGKRLAAIDFIAVHGYGKDTASNLESTSKIIEHVCEIAYKVGGKNFLEFEYPAYIAKLRYAVQKEKKVEAEGEDV